MKKTAILFLFIINFLGIQNVLSDDSKSFMQNVVDDTFSNIVNKGLNDAAAKIEFKNLIKKDVDLDKVAKLLLGKKRLSDLENAGLIADFKDFIAGHLASIYANQIKSGKGAKVTVGDSILSESDPILGTVNIVTTTVETSEYGKVKIQWYISGNRIVDAKVAETFRMSFTLKPQYGEVWKNCGGDAKEFMKTIREKLPH